MSHSETSLKKVVVLLFLFADNLRGYFLSPFYSVKYLLKCNNLHYLAVSQAAEGLCTTDTCMTFGTGHRTDLCMCKARHRYTEINRPRANALLPGNNHKIWRVF